MKIKFKKTLRLILALVELISLYIILMGLIDKNFYEKNEILSKIACCNIAFIQLLFIRYLAND